MTVIENLQREDLNAIEQAEAYVRLASEFGLRQAEIAEKVGKSREAVANIMRLLNLPEYIKDAVRAGTLPGTAARGLLPFQKDPDRQRKMYDALISGGFNSRDVENAASAVKAAVGRRIIRHNEKYDNTMDELSKYLGAPVIIRVPHGTAKTGQIVIRFASQEHLDELVGKITQ